jgi:type IV conjugative transfer system coupling protein TraD
MGFIRQGKRAELVRGAELVRHEFGLYFAAVRFSAGMGLIVFASTFYFAADWLLSARSKEILTSRLVAMYHVSSGTPQTPVHVLLVNGSRPMRYAVRSGDLAGLTAPEWQGIRLRLIACGAMASIASALIVMLTHRNWRRHGRQAGEDEVIRGAVFVAPKAVARELRKRGVASHVAFGGVPLERGCEVLNTMVTGTVGSGKSVAIGGALDGVRLERQKAIVFDPTGEYVERFYRDGRDVILNPFDQRSPLWKPWNEVRVAYDYANLAEGFVPVMNLKEPFWESGAQIVLEDVMSRLAKLGKDSNRALVHAINVMSLDEIQQLVKALPASVYMDPEAARTALGVRMNVVRAAKSLRFLEDGPAGQHFSIRDWVAARDQDSWLFLSCREDMLTTMRPLITAWMDAALRAVMTLGPDVARLIWNVIDELPALDKIPCLNQVATRGRKYGIASILGYQNFAQLKRVYGPEDAQTIISTCQNMLTLRVPDFATAEHVAKNLSAQEVMEKGENVSFGKDPARDGVSISSRRVMRNLVLPSEIQGLAQFHGYLRLAGRNDVMKIAFAYRDYPRIAAPFVERKIRAYDLDE